MSQLSTMGTWAKSNERLKIRYLQKLQPVAASSEAECGKDLQSDEARIALREIELRVGAGMMS